MALILRNATLATLAKGGSEAGESVAGYGLIEGGAVVIEGETIAWAGAERDLPAPKDARRIDLDGRLVTPALIDCHSHTVFAGQRAREFEMRLNGASYADVARAGGGILATVAATRAATEAELLEQSLARVDMMLAEGVATLEIKSGYGLDIETELRMLRTARRIERERPIAIKTSFLGAHALPPEFAGRADEYIDACVIPALRAATAEGLVDAVDGFCETIAFSPEQIARVFEAARALDLPVKLHAEQLSNLGGAKLAARFGALSADHLEYLDDEGAAALARAGTVAVLLPGAFYTLREPQAPPIDALRRAGAAMAVATDCNPGSAPMTSLTLAMNMACTLFRLTPLEALAGATATAARALGLHDRGRIVPGLRADLAIWDAAEPAELSYRIGATPLYRRLFAGRFDD